MQKVESWLCSLHDTDVNGAKPAKNVRFGAETIWHDCFESHAATAIAILTSSLSISKFFDVLHRNQKWETIIKRMTFALFLGLISNKERCEKVRWSLHLNKFLPLLQTSHDPRFDSEDATKTLVVTHLSLPRILMGQISDVLIISTRKPICAPTKTNTPSFLPASHHHAVQFQDHQVFPPCVHVPQCQWP